MNYIKIIKLRNFNSQALFHNISRPQRFQKPLRSFMFTVFVLCSSLGFSQNKLQKQLSAKHIETISINGNQIFSISVSTSNTDEIKVISVLDGEYQNDFQIVVKEEKHTLNLSLEYLSLEDMRDDKRNVHKVIAATLHLEIPENISLNIISDIGSVDLNGTFNSLFIELAQGQCNVNGMVNRATINTLDGDIIVITHSATVEAYSSHGKVTLDEIPSSNSIWKLKSINGNITVAKLD